MTARRAAPGARLRPSREAERRKAKLIELSGRLPEAAAEPVGRQTWRLTAPRTLAARLA